MIEAFGVMRARSARQLLRVEPLVAAACAPLYLLAVELGAPGFWTDLRDTLEVYGAYGKEVPLWSRNAPLLACALGLAAPVSLLRPRGIVPALLAALALASALAAWLQHKDFAYHHIPTGAFAYAALAFALALVVTRLVRGPALAHALLGATAAGCLAWVYLMPRDPRDAELRGPLLCERGEARGDGRCSSSPTPSARPSRRWTSPERGRSRPTAACGPSPAATPRRSAAARPFPTARSRR